MIIHSLCNSCLQPFELAISVSEVSLVKEITDEDGATCPCPRLCGGRINLVGDAVISEMAADRRLRDPIRVTGKQLYQAVNGLGLPDEIPSSKEVLEALLVGSDVVGTVTEEFNRVLFLHEIKLKNGFVIHLGAGLKGAQVLKITKGTDHG